MKLNNKGVTLIALVVTIIVLLILAGVAIATLTGDNGIITKAQEATIMKIIGEVKEKIHLESTQENIENGIPMSAERLVANGKVERIVKQENDGRLYIYYILKNDYYKEMNGLGKGSFKKFEDIFLIDEELNVKYISNVGKEYGDDLQNKELNEETNLTFVSEDFKKYIAQKLGVKPEEIKFGLMKGQTELEIDDPQITSLKDLVFFPKLKTLTLGKYPDKEIKLKNLEGIENCTELTNIKLVKADIESLDGIEGCMQLSSIISSNSYIGDFSNLKYCVSLNRIDYNKAGCTKNIDINNLISSIKNLDNLEYLGIMGIGIKNMQMLSKINSDLKTISLSNNKINKIEWLEKFVNLKSITLTNNDISDITPLAKNEKLMTITLLNNPKIDGNPKNYTGEKLDALNKISEVINRGGEINIDIDKLGLFTNYKILSLANQNLEFLELLEGQTEIESLTLMSNNLKLNDDKSRNILSSMKKCTYLDLSNNKDIEDISFINEMPNLKTLRIKGNSKINLKQIEDKISSLRIDLSNETFSSLSSCDLSKITKINLFGYDGLSVAVPDLSKATNLIDLNISNEPKIQDFSNISNIPSLKILNLSSNSLHGKMIDFSKLTNLQELNLSNNTLSSEDLKVLEQLKDIKNLKLDLSNNSIIDASSLLVLDPSTKIILKNNVNLSEETKTKLVNTFKGNVTF